MNWQQVAANWPAFIPVISDRWPRTDLAELEAIDGDRERFEAHLSSAHDLTRAEAREEVDTWLMSGAPAELPVLDGPDGANISANGQRLSTGNEGHRFGKRPVGRSGEG